MRSLEDLQLKVLQLRIDAPNKDPDHVPLPPHWWLLVGMGFTALVMTCKLARRRRLMHTARTPFGLPVEHLRLNSSWLRLLDENRRSTNDPLYSEPIGSSDYEDSGWSAPFRAESRGHEPAPKKVSNVTATGYERGHQMLVSSPRGSLNCQALSIHLPPLGDKGLSSGNNYLSPPMSGLFN